jgi:hypothetical protein
MTPEALVLHDYRQRLSADDIPPDPAQRTPDQQRTARLEAWAAKLPFEAVTTINLDAGG